MRYIFQSNDIMKTIIKEYKYGFLFGNCEWDGLLFVLGERKWKYHYCVGCKVRTLF